MKRIGRPPKEDPRSSIYRLRMNDEELAKLDYICIKTGKSRAEIFRMGVQMQYDFLKSSE